MGETPTLADEADQGDEAELDDPPNDDQPANDEETVADASDERDEQGDDGDDGPSDDVNEETVEVTEDDLGGGLFSGVEDGGDESDESDGESGGSDDDDGQDVEAIADGLEGNAAAMEGAINEGAARLATVGLTESDFEDSELTKDSLEEEFTETFEAFRLGYFGSRAAEKYILEPADGDVSPAWGLAGSMLMALAMTVWLRPDGDRAVSKAREAVENLTGGAA